MTGWLTVALLVAVVVTQESVVRWLRGLFADARASRWAEPPLSADEAQYLAETGLEAWFEGVVGEWGRDAAIVALRAHTARLAAETEKWAHLAPRKGKS